MSYVLRGGGRDGENTAGTGRPRAAGDFAAGGPAAAAAASVTLVVVLVSAVHLLAGKPPGGGSPGKPPDGSARPAGPPRYYVSAASTGIQVRSTVTGAVTASIPNPFSGPGSLGMFAVESPQATAAGNSWPSTPDHRRTAAGCRPGCMSSA